MATVIDALVVNLGLNGKSFFQAIDKVHGALKRTNKVSGQTAHQMNEHGKQAAMFFGRVRNEALALMAVFTAGMGIKNFTAHTIQSASGLGLMASNLGMSTERLQAWQRAAERAGGSAQGMTAQLRQSAQEIAKLRRGMKTETLGAFFVYGGKEDDLKNGNSYLLARSRIVSDLYKTDKARAALAAQEMGISDDQFDFIRQGPEAIARMVAAQQKRSSISEQDAKDALRLRNLYLDLGNTFEAVGTKVLIALIPTFERLMKMAQKWGDDILKNRDKIVSWVEELIAAIGKFMKVVNDAAQSVGGWKNIFMVLAGLKIMSMAKSITMLAASFVTLAASLVKLGAVSAVAGVSTLARLSGSASIVKAGATPLVAKVSALARLTGAAGLALYSKNLNNGEAETLAAINDPAMKGKRAMEAMRYLEQRSFDRIEAAGIVANLIAESNLDPRAVGDGGQAVGIAQWHPPRQADFKNVFGKDIRESTLSEQLDFVLWELKNTYRSAGHALRTVNTPAQAAEIITRQYEKPRDQDGESRRRGLRAQALYMNADLENGDPAQGRVQSAAQSAVQSARQASPSALLTSPAARGVPNITNDHSSQVTINGPVTVTTNATDAQTMARELQRLNDPQSLALQVDTGAF